MNRASAAPAVPPGIDPEHPWLGLSSYTEETRAYFRGRDEEAAELARRVQRKNLTVLFGQSGLGKTSLLRAGLVPRLRDEGFCPVYVRIDYAAESPPPAEQIKQAIFRATAAAGHWTRPGTAIEGESLWEFLHHRGDLLRDAGGRTLLPLLIFDQFEEIFTLAQADDRGRLRAQQFVDELADLVENRPPLELERRLDQDDAAADDFDFARADYRILIALREDYLAHLESLKGTMPSITQNRMRLARMTGAQALSAVMGPGGRLVTQEVAESIVRFVAGGSELPNAEVEPSLLSLVCRELNNLRVARGRAEISADLLAGSRDTILTEFYERALQDQPAGVRRVIEDELLTESGYRESLAEERVQKALAAAGAEPDTLAKLVDRRLLRIEERLDVRRVELTHDVLCGVVAASRDLRHEREARDEAERQLELQREREAATHRALVKTRVIAMVSAVLMLVAIAGAVFGWVNYRRAHQADLAAQKARADAEKLVGFLIEDFYAELEPTGRLETLGKLANLAVDYYDGLPPELLTRQTRIYRGMAMIRAGRVMLAGEQVEPGSRKLTEARTLFEELRAEGDNSREATYGLALSLFAPYMAWGVIGGPNSEPGDLPRAAELLRPLLDGGEEARATKILYADVLNYLSHLQPKEQSIGTCEEARSLLASIGALDLTDLTAASVYADTADSQARHSMVLGRLEEAARLEAEVYDIAEKVLARRPGDIRSMQNRALAADLLGRIARRRQDFDTALQEARRAERAGEDLVRFNPSDIGLWVHWFRGRDQVADVLFEQGRIAESIAMRRGTLEIATDERRPASLEVFLEETAYALAETLASLGQPGDAEHAFERGIKATEETAAQLPEGSPRRQLTLIRIPGEHAFQSLYMRRYQSAFDEAHEVLATIDSAAIDEADVTLNRFRDEMRHWMLEIVNVAGVRIGRYPEAEAAARRHLDLPAPMFRDLDRERARERVQLATALALQGKGGEATGILAPALEFYRPISGVERPGITQQFDFAEALWVGALAQAGDPAGRAARQRMLAEASRELARIPAEARSLREVQDLTRRIAEAKAGAAG